MVFFVVLTYLHGTGSWNSHWWYNVSYVTFDAFFSPPARWGLLDFMSVASSSSSSSFVLPPSRPLSSSSSSSLLLSSPRLLSSSPLLLLPAGLQPRPSTPSVPCRTSTTTIHAQCSLPDLNREYPGPVFPAGPEPRPSTPSVPCRTSTAKVPWQKLQTKVVSTSCFEMSWWGSLEAK